jgi:hypothetical protein
VSEDEEEMNIEDSSIAEEDVDDEDMEDDDDDLDDLDFEMDSSEAADSPESGDAGGGDSSGGGGYRSSAGSSLSVDLTLGTQLFNLAFSYACLGGFFVRGRVNINIKLAPIFWSHDFFATRVFAFGRQQSCLPKA